MKESGGDVSEGSADLVNQKGPDVEEEDQDEEEGRSPSTASNKVRNSMAPSQSSPALVKAKAKEEDAALDSEVKLADVQAPQISA